MSSRRMTPLERTSCALAGARPDTLPIVVINANTFVCTYYGITVEEYVSDPHKCAEVQIRFIKEFGIDCANVSTGYILYGAGPEMGVTWKFAGDNFPGFTEGPIKSEADLARSAIPAEPSGYFKNYLDSIGLVHEALGATHHLKANVIGPFTVGCFLHGLEQTLMALIQDPDFFRELMAHCTDLSVYFGRNVQATGLRNLILNEIFLTPGMISPAAYHGSIAPYDREVQRLLGPEEAPNSFLFIGKPDDPESQRQAGALNSAFFGVGESIDAIRRAAEGEKPPGFPFPVGITGRALDQWDSDRIDSFLREAADFLVHEKGIFPAICLASVQAVSREKAGAIADKLRVIKEFRDSYSP